MALLTLFPSLPTGISLIHRDRDCDYFRLCCINEWICRFIQTKFFFVLDEELALFYDLFGRDLSRGSWIKIYKCAGGKLVEVRD